MRSLHRSLAAGLAALALLAVPAAAHAQIRVLPTAPHFNANGATHTVPFPSRVFVPPFINSTTVQSNWNHWAYGGYPNIVAAANTRLALHELALANRYAMYATLYNPYMNPYVYNSAMM